MTSIKFSRPRFLEKNEEVVVPFTISGPSDGIDDSSIVEGARRHVQDGAWGFLKEKDIDFSVYKPSGLSLKGCYIKFSPPWL